MNALEIIENKFPPPYDLRMEKLMRVMMGKDRIFQYGDFVFTVSPVGIVHMYGGEKGKLEKVAERFLKDAFDKTGLSMLVGVAKRKACLYFVRKLKGQYLGTKDGCYMFAFYKEIK